MLGDIENLLKSSKAQDRKSAAKKLRKEPNPHFCSALISSVEKEIIINKSWEAQYHLIMALGQSCCDKSLQLLKENLFNKKLEPLVRVALSDSITRIQDNCLLLYQGLEKQDLDIIHGTLRAMTFKKIKLPVEIAYNVLKFTRSFKNDLTYYWVAAASPGCDSLDVKLFLNEAINSNDDQLSKAAKNALLGKYTNWSIL